MDYSKLIIGDVLVSDNKVIIITTFVEREAKLSAIKESKTYFEEKFRNKRLLITGDNYTIETDIIDIECTSNISDFKNINFLTELTKIGDIKTNDFVMVID